MDPLNAKKLGEYHTFTQRLAERGAAVAADNYKKSGTAKPLPAINQEIAALVLGEINHHFPEHRVIDDASLKAEQLADQSPTWVVDYLDGEKNYSLRFPYFACSAALYANGACQTAAVVDGLHGEVFSFANGLGSFYNGQELTTPPNENPRSSVISVSWAGDMSSAAVRDSARELNVKLAERVGPIFPQQRRAGSIALDLCNIAAGRFGGMYAYNPVLVDLAAGLPIALAAGCEAVDFNGNKFQYGDRTLVLAQPRVMEVLLPHILATKIPMVRTSDSHPYTIDFFPQSVIGTTGKLGLSYAPGKKDGGEAFSVRRNLPSDLSRIKSLYGVEVIVSLIEDHEYAQLGMTSFFRQAEKRGLEVLRLPIVDFGIPATNESLLHLLVDINTRLEEGKNILVHCKQGIGRTGIVAACLLMYKKGLSAEEAMRLVKDTRNELVRFSETQQEFIVQFGLWLKEQ